MLKVKNIVVILLICVAFASGVLFENIRIAEQADLTVAVLIAKLGKDSIEFNKNIHSEYIDLLDGKNYKVLKEKVEESLMNLTLMQKNAYDPCSEAECSSDQLRYLHGKNK